MRQRRDLIHEDRQQHTYLFLHSVEKEFEQLLFHLNHNINGQDSAYSLQCDITSCLSIVDKIANDIYYYNWKTEIVKWLRTK